MSRPLNLRRDFFSPQSSLLISAEKDFYPDRKTLLSRPQTTVIPTKDYCHPDHRLLSSRPQTTVIPTVVEGSQLTCRRSFGFAQDDKVAPIDRV
jgi:hypothetical protein